MSSSGQKNTRQDHDDAQAKNAGEHQDSGHTGEGAASAMQHLISQDQEHRRRSGEAGDAAGGKHE